MSSPPFSFPSCAHLGRAVGVYYEKCLGCGAYRYARSGGVWALTKLTSFQHYRRYGRLSCCFGRLLLCPQKTHSMPLAQVERSGKVAIAVLLDREVEEWIQSLGGLEFHGRINFALRQLMDKVRLKE